MASSTSTTPASLSDSYFSSVSNFISVKLDRKNYSCWLAQIVPVLRSRKLMSFVDGSSSCPSPTISRSSSKEGDAPSSPTPNPAYDEWIQKDQLVLSWINGSLHSSVLSTVSRLSTARDTWLSLEKRFASTNPHRLLFLQSELHNTLRGDSSVQEFLDRIKSIADDLGQAGESVSESLLVSLILKNVGPMYETVVSAVLSRGTPITYDELEVLLLSAEKRLHFAHVPLATSGVSAFVASRSRGGGHRGDSPLNSRGSFSTPCGGGRRGGYTHGSVDRSSLVMAVVVFLSVVIVDLFSHDMVLQGFSVKSLLKVFVIPLLPMVGLLLRFASVTHVKALAKVFGFEGPKQSEQANKSSFSSQALQI
ncbi:hypothetical protein ACE6H2_023351 [Prunus campanulata]